MDESRVAIAKARFRSADWARTFGEKGSANSTDVFVPLAYAVLEVLIEDIGDDRGAWVSFLHDAIDEIAAVYG